MTTVKNTAKTTAKAQTKKNYIKVSAENIGVNASVEETIMWIKPANFDKSSITIDVGNNEAISGYEKAIVLKNVNVSIAENDNGYPTILIQGC